MRHNPIDTNTVLRDWIDKKTAFGWIREEKARRGVGNGQMKP